MEFSNSNLKSDINCCKTSLDVKSAETCFNHFLLLLVFKPLKVKLCLHKAQNLITAYEPYRTIFPMVKE